MWTAWRLFVSRPNARGSLKSPGVLVHLNQLASFVVEANGGLICVQTAERIMVAADFRAGLRCAL
jgi:hypothetical protein